MKERGGVLNDEAKYRTVPDEAISQRVKPKGATPVTIISRNFCYNPRMDNYAEKLNNYIVDHKISAEILHFSETCHSAEDAAKALNADLDQIAKSICLVDSHDKTIIAIVKGPDRVSMTKIAEALNIRKPRPATRDEVLNKTGYPAGGTPPFGYDAVFLIDPTVMEKDTIYGGGGSENAVTRISPIELQKANQGRIVRINK